MLLFIQSVAIPVDRQLAYSKQVPTSVHQNTQTVICTSRLYYYSILVAIYPRHICQCNFTLLYVCCCFPKQNQHLKKTCRTSALLRNSGHAVGANLQSKKHFSTIPLLTNHQLFVTGIMLLFRFMKYEISRYYFLYSRKRF